MSLVEYHTILRHRLMIPLYSIDEVYLVCRKVCLNTFGEHVVHCKEFPGFKHMHDFTMDVLFDIFRQTEVLVKKEPPMNFLTNPLDKRSTLRHADDVMYGWLGGKHACVDLIRVSPFVGSKVKTFMV